MNKNIFIAPLLIVLFSFSLTLFIFTPVSFKNIAQALTGNYSKSTGEQLTITDWNNLSGDFVAKSGDTMGGSLNMNSNRISNLANPTNDTDAVNRGAMNSAISNAISSLSGSSITDISGVDMKVVCGRSPSLNKDGFSTNWINWGANSVRYNTDFSAAGFTATPIILSSLEGEGYLYQAVGGGAVYQASPTGFNTRIYYIGAMPMDENVVRTTSWDWHVSWCAMGY